MTMQVASMTEIDMPSSIITIVDTVPWHLRELAANIQPEDERELLAIGLTPPKALWRSYKSSIYCKTALLDGRVAAVWGAAGTFLSDSGCPWLLTSREIRNISSLRIARDYQREVHKMLDIFQKLENYCDARYTAAIRLLDIVGFNIEDPSPLGENRQLFRKFKMVRG